MGECTGRRYLSSLSMSEIVRSLICLSACFPGWEISDLVVGVDFRMWVPWSRWMCVSRVWGFLSVCEYVSQGMRFLICLSLYAPGCEVFLSLGERQGYEVSDLFLILCPWMLDLWSLSGCMYQCVSSLTCLRVCIPRCKVSELFVDIFPWLLYFWAFLLVFSGSVSTLIGLLCVCYRRWGLFGLRVSVPEYEVSAVFVWVY